MMRWANGSECVPKCSEGGLPDRLVFRLRFGPDDREAFDGITRTHSEHKQAYAEASQHTPIEQPIRKASRIHLVCSRAPARYQYTDERGWRANTTGESDRRANQSSTVG